MFRVDLPRVRISASALLLVLSALPSTQAQVEVARGRFFELAASPSDLLVETFGQATVMLAGAPPISGELASLHDGRIFADGVIDETSALGSFRPADGTVVEIALTKGCGPIAEIAVLSAGAPGTTAQRYTLEARCEDAPWEVLARVDVPAGGEEALRTSFRPDPEADLPEFGAIRITFHVAPEDEPSLYREIDVDSTTGPACPPSNARCDEDVLVESPPDDGPGFYNLRATDARDLEGEDLVFRFRLVRQLEDGTRETRFLSEWQLSPERRFDLLGFLDADSPPGPDLADDSSGDWEFLIEVDDIPVCGDGTPQETCPGTMIVVDPVDLRGFSSTSTAAGDLVSRFGTSLERAELFDANGDAAPVERARALHDDTPFGKGSIESEDATSAFLPVDGDEIRFVLDAERSPNGYRIDEMRFLTASVARRTSQSFEVRVATVDEPSRFGLLYSARFAGPPSGELLTSLRRRDPDGSERTQPVARRVAEIRVRFYDAPGEPAASVWREIDVFGEPDGAIVQIDRLRRGDANDDGSVDLSDAVFVFTYLFSGGADLVCPDAGDANDDGTLDLSDGVYGLNYLFQGRTPPLAPFPGCGEDPSGDSLARCESNHCA